MNDPRRNKRSTVEATGARIEIHDQMKHHHQTDLNGMVGHVGNFCRKSSNDVSTLSVVGVMWSIAEHQLVSGGHVDNVRWSQLELKRVDVDVTQYKPHKVVLGIIAILNSCRQ